MKDYIYLNQKWWLGWSRNIAIGVIWTKDGKIAIFFLGLTLANYPSSADYHNKNKMSDRCGIVEGQ